MQALFAWDFQKTITKDSLVKKTIKNIKAIDKIIAKAAPQWELSKMAKVDLAILRLAVCELLFLHLEPPRVIINEAVELAKTFGADQSSSFVNGVLGTVYDNFQK